MFLLNQISNKAWLKICTSLILLSSLVLVLSYLDIPYDDLRPTKVKEYLLGFGLLKGSVLYVAVYTFSLRPFVPIPPVVYTIVGGFTFGPLIGAPLAIVGATLNASLSYIVAKTLGRDFVEGYINNRFGSFNRMLSNNEFKVILLLRASPIGAPFDMVSYASGLLGVSFWTYFAATMLGIIPVVGVYSYFGASVGKRGIAPLVGVFVMLLLFILLPIYFKRRRNVSSEAVK